MRNYLILIWTKYSVFLFGKSGNLKPNIDLSLPKLTFTNIQPEAFSLYELRQQKL